MRGKRHRVAQVENSHHLTVESGAVAELDPAAVAALCGRRIASLWTWTRRRTMSTVLPDLKRMGMVGELAAYGANAK